MWPSIPLYIYMRVRIRVRAAEQRLIATGSQVNVAEQRLKDTQSQGDDSPATPLRLTSSSAAINRSEAAFRVRQLIGYFCIFAP